MGKAKVRPLVGGCEIKPAKSSARRQARLEVNVPVRERDAESQTAEARITSALAPALVPIPEACAFSGFSRSELYRRLTAGKIEARKVGTRTLIVVASLKAHMDSLPKAKFHAPRRTA